MAGATASGAGMTANPATVSATPAPAAVSPAVWTKYRTVNGRNIPVPRLSVTIAARKGRRPLTDRRALRSPAQASITFQLYSYNPIYGRGDRGLSWRHEPRRRAGGHRTTSARPPRAPRDHAGTRPAPRDVRL